MLVSELIKKQCLNIIALINHVSFRIDKEARQIELCLKPKGRPVSSFFYKLNILHVHNSSNNISRWICFSNPSQEFINNLNMGNKIK
jgi:hypothetical protein